MKKPCILRAFTLLEVILAIAIGSIVLCSASYYLYTLTLLYTEVIRAPRFEEHADTVAKFLEDAMSTASAQGNIMRTLSPIFWVEASFEHHNELLLAFKSNVGIGINTQLNIPAQAQEIAFIFDKKLGLILALKRLDITQAEPDLIEYIQLSPLVSEVSYAYYDNDSNIWNIVEEPISDTKKLPQALEITFKDRGNQSHRWVYLPTTIKTLPQKSPTSNKKSSQKLPNPVGHKSNQNSEI